jgi:hypothetical protein
MSAYYQPYQSLRLLCVAKESLINTQVFDELMIYTHSTSPISICYTHITLPYALLKRPKNTTPSKMGSSRGRSQ